MENILNYKIVDGTSGKCMFIPVYFTFLLNQRMLLNVDRRCTNNIML